MANHGRQVTAAPGAPFWRQALESYAVNLALDRQKRIHAVIDGAFFDDLPKLFDDHGLAARPLFTGNTPQALVNAGPWLVDLYHMPFQEPDETAMATGSDGADGPDLSDEALKVQAAALAEDMRRLVEAGDDTGGLGQKSDEDAWPSGPPADPAAQIRALIHIAGDKPALVFWIGGPDLTPARLWKHLRSINMVRVPDDEKPDETEAVQFRHADGNVLASVLPVLDAAQFARLFGPALALTFHAPDYPYEDGWPVRRAVHPLTGAQTPPGMLALTVEQIREVEAARLELSRRETMAYLRIHAADETANFDDEGLYREVVAIEKRGYALGLEDMSAHLLFAFMAVTGCASVVESEVFTELTENSGKHPDEVINDVFDGMISGGEADMRGTL